MLEDDSDNESEAAFLPDGLETVSIDGNGHTPASSSQARQQTTHRSRRQRLERFNSDITNLLYSDFTRDLIVVFETDSAEPSEAFRRVLLRNKIDTGSDENFISHRIIERYWVKAEAIRAIPASEQTERELSMVGGYKLKPQREVTLEWYRPKDTQKREGTFVIADNDPPFNILICKRAWDAEIPRLALPIFGRHKTKGTFAFNDRA